MPESQAFAIATQQSHALGKSPKGYGTAEGKATAKAKYTTPGDDKKTAGVLMHSYGSMRSEILKIANVGESLLQLVKEHPHIASTAAGAGVGALEGGEGHRLQGAAAGGLIGAGASHLHQHLGKVQGARAAAQKEVGSALEGAASHAAAAPRALAKAPKVHISGPGVVEAPKLRPKPAIADAEFEAVKAASMWAMADEFTKIGEYPPLFTMTKGLGATAKGVAGGALKAAPKSVVDVSRGMHAAGDNIKAGPIPAGLRSFSGKLPPPLPKTG